jgi:hypothetical protein
VAQEGRINLLFVAAGVHLFANLEESVGNYERSATSTVTRPGTLVPVRSCRTTEQKFEETGMPDLPVTNRDVVVALDELFGAIDRYRTSAGFRELLEFVRRLPTVSPYYGLLLHLQRPGVAQVATLRGWQGLGRVVKREANPLVTLRPFGPVEFVYDISDTTGPALPADISNPFRATGHLGPDVSDRTCRTAESDAIAI